MINWIKLTKEEQLSDIQAASASKPQVIFKHSTRCSISSMVLSRLERESVHTEADFYYLDLIAFRPVSNEVAEKFHVHHESPQVLVIRNGECIYDESHMGITMNEIAQQVA